MRTFIEIVISFIKGVAAFFIYLNVTRFLFLITYKHTTLLYESLKKIPCEQDPCKLRYFVSLLAFIIRDTLFALPVLFIFGFLLGLLLKYYRVSRPVILCLGFFLAQYSYNFMTGAVSEFPVSVHIAHSLPIIVFIILFTKLGYSLKSKKRYQKIARAIHSETAPPKTKESSKY